MAQTQTKNVAISSTVYSWKNEIVAVILTLFGIIVFLSLVTFNPNDTSINTSSGNPSKNLIGIVGAGIADLVLQTIGLTAYLLPFLLLFGAWRSFRSENLRTPVWRILGVLLLILSICGLLMLFGFTTIFDGSIVSGGLLGVLIGGSLPKLLGVTGSIIVLFGFAITSVLMITGRSLREIYEEVGYFFINLRAMLRIWNENSREWREKQNLLAQERLQKRQEVREKFSQTDVLHGDEKTETEKSKPKTAEKEPLIIDEEPLNWRDKLANMFNRLSQPPEEVEYDDDETIDDMPNILYGDDDDTGIVSMPKPVAKKPAIETAKVTIDGVKIEPKVEIQQIELPKIEPKFEPKFEPIAQEVKVDIGNIGISPVLDGDADERESHFSRNLDNGNSSQNLADAVAAETVQPIQPELPRVPQTYNKYKLPTTDFLTSAPARIDQKDEELLAIAQELTEKCKEFNVTGRVMHICQGPVVTTYEYKPDPGVKYSRITNLSDDLCLALKAESIRIDRIPGKAFVGIEVPNPTRETIHLREVIESKKFKESTSLLTVALGKTIDGLNFVADLAKMPHLLVAGATGAGKSVGVNSLIVSILYKAKPNEVKFIMVDPKRLELGLYADIPHLATPIITEPKRASIALKWAVSEMERRYKELAGWGVRNIDGFNTEVKRRNSLEQFDDNGEPHKTLPLIVIIVDELADLMMTSGKEVEESITRLAQMARAVGIHLVLATQRPSVDVITGLIKANFPSRISFRVSSKIDSRTILDANGSERLLGKGDMLFLPPSSSQIIRVHGGYVDEIEIARIVEHIKGQGAPDYDTTITKTDEEMEGTDGLPGKKDELFWDALRVTVSAKRGSTSLLQRHLRIGYGRAAAILDAMVREGYIGDMDGSSRARPVLEKAYQALNDHEDSTE